MSVADINFLALQLGRARLAYERRPDNDRAYTLFLEAENRFLKAEARVREAEKKAAVARMNDSLGKLRRVEASYRRQIGVVWDQVRRLKRTVRKGRRHQARAKEVLADMFGGGVD